MNNQTPSVDIDKSKVELSALHQRMLYCQYGIDTPGHTTKQDSTIAKTSSVQPNINTVERGQLFTRNRITSNNLDENTRREKHFLQRQLRTFFLPSKTRRASLKKLGNHNGKNGSNLEMDDWIIHPHSNFRLYWDMYMVFVILINLVVIPVDVAFYADSEFHPHFMTFNLFSDMCFCIDIIFNFRTGIFQDDVLHPVNTDPKAIASHYLKTWFTIDLLSTVPFDYILALFVSSDMLGVSRLVRLAKFLSLLKLLRFSRLIRYLSACQENFVLFSSGTYVRIFNLICFMLMVAHWNGCLQFLAANLQGFDQKTWCVHDGLVPVGGPPNKSVFVLYSNSIFRALSQMISIGFGVSSPLTVTDMWLVVLGMLTGAFGFAMITGNIICLLQTIDMPRKLHKNRTREVEDYMSFRKFPKELRVRIRDYFEMRYRGRAFDEERIIAGLSEPLKEFVMRHNCSTTLRMVPFFATVDEAFISDLVTDLRYEFYQPGDIVIKRGSLGTKMYFIQQGEVVVEHDGIPISTLGEGQYFGEVCLVLPCRRSATVRASTHCSFFTLSVADFNQVLQRYPVVKMALDSVADDMINMQVMDNVNVDDTDSAFGDKTRSWLWRKQRANSVSISGCENYNNSYRCNTIGRSNSFRPRVYSEASTATNTSTCSSRL